MQTVAHAKRGGKPSLKLLGMLGSHHDGEMLNAAGLADRFAARSRPSMARCHSYIGAASAKQQTVLRDLVDRVVASRARAA